MCIRDSPIILLLLQGRPKLLSIHLFCLHLRQHLWTWLCIHQVRLKFNWNIRPEILKQFIDLIRIDSLPFQHCQFGLRSVNNLLIIAVLEVFLHDHHNELLVLAEKTLLDGDLITLSGTENVILLNLTCEFL